MRSQEQDLEDQDAQETVFLRGFDHIEAKSAARANVARRKKYLKWFAVVAAVAAALGLLIGVAVGVTRRASAPYACPETTAQYDTTFFVIGDWGRHGNANQQRAAQMMGDVGACMAPEFVVSTGDNFYDAGLTGAADPAFAQSWRDVYTAPALQVPWYVTLGNHDYNNGIDPTANSNCAATTLEACPKDCCYSASWQHTSAINDVRWHAANGSWAVPAGPTVALVMMDTNAFIRPYLSTPWAANAGGLLEQNATATREAAVRALQTAYAPWRLLVGHHPVMSYGKHCNFENRGDCDEMRDWELRLQELNVAAYFCGHEHDLQLVAPPAPQQEEEQGEGVGGVGGEALVRPASAGPVYVVSGAGSDVRPNEFTTRSSWPPDLKFVADDQGFVAVRANATALVMHFYASSRSLPSYTAVITR